MLTKVIEYTIPPLKRIGIEEPLGYEWTFPNNYGGSVIRHNGSYGHESDLFELAVIHDNKVCYRTTIVYYGVEGWLDEDGVDALLDKIKQLPPNPACDHKLVIEIPED